MKESESTEHEEPTYTPETEHPNYHYKWMIVLLVVGIIGSFVFSALFGQK